MRRALILAGIVLLGLIAAPAALAKTETAHAGNVTATFSFQGKVPTFHGLHLTITRGGTVAYDQPVVAKLCDKLCWPGPLIGGGSAVQVIALEHTGDPDVMLNLFSGGAHCCTVVQVFSFDPGAMTYVKTERNFGDPGTRVVDLQHNGDYEFLTADDSFAYRFTDYAASGLPIEILSFAAGHFTDVTRSYPTLVTRDAAVWLKAFKSTAKEHYADSVGVIAAWAADEDLLGHVKLVNRYLAQQAKAGHLNGPFGAGGSKFVAELQKFLRRHGYRH
jgi:hypothetical protein